MEYRSYTNDTDLAIDTIVSDNIILPNTEPHRILGTGGSRNVRGLTIENSNGNTTYVDDGKLYATLSQDLRTTAHPTFNGVSMGNYSFEALSDNILFMWDIAAEYPTAIFYPSTSEYGIAMVVPLRFITMSGIDFLFEGYNHWPTAFQRIVATRPEAKTGDRYWTLPDTGITNTTFAALEAKQTFTDVTDSKSTTTGAVTFAGGVGIAKTLHANAIDTSTLTVDGKVVTPDNYVTLNTTQTVTGQKTFLEDISTGTGNYGRINLSTYGGGQSNIRGGYTTDADHFLEFYARNTKVFEIRNGYPEQKLFNVYGPVTAAGVHPMTSGTHNLGTPTRQFGNVYSRNATVENGGGSVAVTCNNGQATVTLTSADGRTTTLNMGFNATTGAKWHFSGRSASETDNFKIYRGPGLAGAGTYQSVMTFTGSGANAGRVTFDRDTEATSVGTGAVILNGGMSVAKNVHIGGEVTVQGTTLNPSNYVTLDSAQTVSGVKTFSSNIKYSHGSPQRLMKLGNDMSVGWSDSRFVDSTSSVVLGHLAGINIAQPSDLATYLTKANTIVGAYAGTTTAPAAQGNAYFGYLAGGDIGGDFNVAVGYKSFDSTGTTPGPLCMYNTSVGAYSMNRATMDEFKVSYNTTVGYSSMREINVGTGNTSVGSNAGRYFTSGNNSTFVGYNSRGTGSTVYNQTAIGANAVCPANNHCRIGDSNFVALTLGNVNSTIGTPSLPVGAVYIRDMVLSGTTVLPNGKQLYQQMTKTGVYYTWIGGTVANNSPVFITCVRVGNMVTATFKAVSIPVTSGHPTLGVLAYGIPSGYIPETSVSVAIFCTVNNQYPVPGICTIDDIGSVNVRLVNGSHYFTGPGINGIDGFSVSYSVHQY